ncbi:MAG: hypothetical protein ACE5KE_05055 [Methanosarcinales archaeon]
MRNENKVLNRELSIALDSIKKLEEEHRSLKEENQKLRLALYGIKKTIIRDINNWTILFSAI